MNRSSIKAPASPSFCPASKPNQKKKILPDKLPEEPKPGFGNIAERGTCPKASVVHVFSHELRINMAGVDHTQEEENEVSDTDGDEGKHV